MWGSLSLLALLFTICKSLKIAHSIDDDESSIGKFGGAGCFDLYLDFINLFLRLLQIFGKEALKVACFDNR